MKTEEITNSENIIDSRDIIARVEYLRGELDALCEAVTDTPAGEDEQREEAKEKLAEWLGCEVSNLPDDVSILSNLKESGYDNGSDEAQELAILENVAEQGENVGGDWPHGEALIRHSYFTDYAQELADDIGAINREAQWPCCHIDWEAAAEALKMDYSTIDFDGVEYYIRS